MDLLQKLVEDQKEAMKAKDKLKLSVIRCLRSELKYEEIEAKGQLKEDDVTAVLQREIKKRKEVLADYEKADRPSLLQELRQEIDILSSYLPPQLSEEEITAIAREVIAEQGAASAKDTGRVMKALMPGVKGKADGSLVKRIVQELLQ